MKKSKENFLDYLKSNRSTDLETGSSEIDIRTELGILGLLSDSLIVVYNFPAVRVDFHKGFNEILGYPKNQKITAEFMIGLIHPDDKPAVEFLALQASKYQFSNGSNSPFETMTAINFRVRKYDGSYLMMINRSTGFKYKNGVPESTINILQDVSFIKEIDKVRSTIIGDAESITEHHKQVSGLYVEKKQIQHFTAREMEVLRLLANGMPSKEIAKELFISTHTVNNHRKNMLKRAGLKNTAELIKLGLKSGLL